MVMSEETKKELEKVVKPVMEFMNNHPEYFCPHHVVRIDPTRVEILQGQMIILKDEFIK